jgi:integrase/recombinase XerD
MVDEAIAQWAPWVERQVSANTTLRYVNSLEQLRPYVAGRFIDEIDGKLIAEIVRERSRTVTNGTIKRDLVSLSSVMNFSVGQGWVEMNPVLPRMRLVKERRDPICLPLPDSVDMMLVRLSGNMRALMQAAIATGARQEELASLRWHQVDLDRKRLTVIGKGNKRRVVDLVPFNGWKVFAGLARGTPQGYVFTLRGDRYKAVSNVFSRLCKSMASDTFVPFRWHDLRHLHAVQWLQAGRSLYDLKERLGHKSVQTTEMYLEFLTPEEKRRAKEQG